MNKPELIAVNDMPDVASHELQQPHVTLDWVGMSDIHQPLLVRDGKQTKHVQTRVQIYVDLGDELQQPARRRQQHRFERARPGPDPVQLRS